MFRKLIMLICLVSFFPAAAGAQDVALLVNSQPLESPAALPPTKEVNLTPPLEKLAAANMLAANNASVDRVSEARPHKTHEGLTFKEFAEVHWGEYRWIYWVGAVTGIVLLHVLAFSHD